MVVVETLPAVWWWCCCRRGDIEKFGMMRGRSRGLQPVPGPVGTGVSSNPGRTDAAAAGRARLGARQPCDSAPGGAAPGRPNQLETVGFMPSETRVDVQQHRH